MCSRGLWCGFLRRLLARGRSNSGGAIIEFALSLPLLIVLLSGSTDYGLMLKEHAAMVEAAYSGARAASQQPIGTSQTDLTSTAQFTAQTMLQQARLNPADYLIQVHPLSINLEHGPSAQAVQVTISRGGDGRSVILTSSGVSSCVKSVAILSSGVAPRQFPQGSEPRC